jgi:hypothetical protein
MSDSVNVSASALQQQELGAAIGNLLKEARSYEKVERRAETRHPFFRPVSIQLAADPRRLVSAFAREISPGGIGLLHSLHIEPGEATLSISRPDGQPLCVRAEILWCRPCGEGWYLSGGRFSEIVS